VRNLVEGNRLEKRPPSGDLGFLHALTAFVIASRNFENPAAWTGFFHVPSSQDFSREGDGT